MKLGRIVLLLFFVSCKSTESINRFAKSAAAAVTVTGQENPSFGSFCRLYGPDALIRYTDTAVIPKTHRVLANCQIYDQSDSLTDIINQTLEIYFTMLQALSDKKLIAYNANSLVSSLQQIQNEVLPAINLSDEKVSAIKGLLNTVLNEPLKWYRHDKLVNTIKKTDSSLERVLSVYIFILDTALAGEIDQVRENYTSFVYSPTYELSRNPVEKIYVNQQYNLFMAARDEQSKTIHKSIRMLETIRKDHHLISFGIPAQSFAETEAEIASDIVKINKTIREIILILK
jgi:hypothetical protein